MRTIDNIETYDVVRPWDSGLSFDEQCAQEDLAMDEAERVWEVIGSHPDAENIRSAGMSYMRNLASKIEADGYPAVFQRYPAHYDSDIELIAGVQFKQVIDIVFNRTYPFFEGGR